MHDEYINLCIFIYKYILVIFIHKFLFAFVVELCRKHVLSFFGNQIAQTIQHAYFCFSVIFVRCIMPTIMQHIGTLGLLKLVKAAAFKASSSSPFLDVSCLHQLLLDHDSIQDLGKKYLSHNSWFYSILQARCRHGSAPERVRWCNCTFHGLKPGIPLQEAIYCMKWKWEKHNVTNWTKLLIAKTWWSCPSCQ